MTLRPLRDYLVVRPLDDAQAGLIRVVRSGRPRRGEVLAIGPGKSGKPLDTRPHDIVQFTDVMTYPEFYDGPTKLLIIQEADVCGIETDIVGKFNQFHPTDPALDGPAWTEKTA